MSANTPTTIAEYLDQLRDALKGADPALVQDALYDAEEHLRSELADNRGISEAELLAKMATTYGVPEEVAEIYRDKEIQITRALRTPPRKPAQSIFGKFFGVIADPRAYAGLFYMLLSLATGIFYFTFVVTGLSLSIGLSILIVGIPVALLFLGLVHVLSLVEGRMVEVMLGERMPRRPVYPAETGFWARIGALITDPRTWTTMLYFVMMLPLGIVYFTIVVTGMSTSLAFIAAPFLWLLDGGRHNHFSLVGIYLFGAPTYMDSIVWLPVLFVLGVIGLFTMMHIARGVGYLHGQIAKVLLVRYPAN